MLELRNNVWYLDDQPIPAAVLQATIGSLTWDGTKFVDPETGDTYPLDHMGEYIQALMPATSQITGTPGSLLLKEMADKKNQDFQSGSIVTPPSGAGGDIPPGLEEGDAVSQIYTDERGARRLLTELRMPRLTIKQVEGGYVIWQLPVAKPYEHELWDQPVGVDAQGNITRLKPPPGKPYELELGGRNYVVSPDGQSWKEVAPRPIGTLVGKIKTAWVGGIHIMYALQPNGDAEFIKEIPIGPPATTANIEQLGGYDIVRKTDGTFDVIGPTPGGPPEPELWTSHGRTFLLFGNQIQELEDPEQEAEPDKPRYWTDIVGDPWMQFGSGQPQRIGKEDPYRAPLTPDQLMGQLLEEAINTGDYSKALALRQFRNSPSPMDQLDAALKFAETPAEASLISAIARGESPLPTLAPGQTRALPKPDFAVEAYNRYQQSIFQPPGPMQQQETLAQTMGFNSAAELQAASRDRSRPNENRPDLWRKYFPLEAEEKFPPGMGEGYLNPLSGMTPPTTITNFSGRPEFPTFPEFPVAPTTITNFSGRRDVPPPGTFGGVLDPRYEVNREWLDESVFNPPGNDRYATEMITDPAQVRIGSRSVFNPPGDPYETNIPTPTGEWMGGGGDEQYSLDKPHILSKFWDRYPYEDVVGLAAGGIVTRPTKAILGENGPEAVIPLTNQSIFGQSGIRPPVGGLSQSLRDLSVPTKGSGQGGPQYPMPITNQYPNQSIFSQAGLTPPVAGSAFRQLGAGRPLQQPRSLFRSVGMPIPSAQAYQRLLPSERELFFQQGRLRSLSNPDMMAELDRTLPGPATSSLFARTTPQRSRAVV